MKSLSISELRQNLPATIDQVVHTGQELLVMRRGKPIVKLVPAGESDSTQNRTPLRGVPIRMSKDFDEPLPNLWDAFRK